MCYIPEILLAGAIGVLMMCGMFISLSILKCPDLTCEASYAVGCSIYCYLNAICNISPMICLIISMIIGIICGGITAILKLYLNVPKVISSMITTTAAIGMLQIFPRIDYIANSNLKLCNFVSLNTLIVIVIAASVASLLYFFITSEIGLKFRAIICNNTLSTNTSNSGFLSLIAGLSIANSITALAGALSSQLANTSAVCIGNGTFIFGLTCILIAELVVKKHKYSTGNFFLTTLVVGAILKSSLELFEHVLNLDKNYAFAEVILAFVAVFVYSVLTSRRSVQMQLIKQSMKD